MKEPQMRLIASFINEAIENRNTPQRLEDIKRRVLSLTKKFPLYPELLKR